MKGVLSTIQIYNKVLLYGHCMGAVVAGELAGRHPDTNLVLDRAPSSLPEAVGSAVDNIYESLKGKEGALYQVPNAMLGADGDQIRP